MQAWLRLLHDAPNAYLHTEARWTEDPDFKTDHPIHEEGYTTASSGSVGPCVRGTGDVLPYLHGGDENVQ